jgi:hypothetical protein
MLIFNCRFDPEEVFKDYCVKLGQRQKQIHRQLDPLRSALRVAYSVGDRQLEGNACRMLATAYMVLAKDATTEKPKPKPKEELPSDDGTKKKIKPKRHGRNRGIVPKPKVAKKKKGDVPEVVIGPDGKVITRNGTSDSDERLISVDLSKTFATEVREV